MRMRTFDQRHILCTRMYSMVNFSASPGNFTVHQLGEPLSGSRQTPLFHRGYYRTEGLWWEPPSGSPWLVNFGPTRLKKHNP